VIEAAASVFPGDTGTRPVQGVFWESPDVHILPGVVVLG
jgi:hypothetical protein